jgi:putative redox protein
MDAKVVWKSRMSFDATADSGFSVQLGSQVEHGGDNDGFRPMELLLIGLGGCTAMDVISILEKKRQDVKSFEILVHADRADDHPRVFTKATIEYVVTGNQINRQAVERAVQLSSEKYCPAQAMFAKIMAVELKITIKE